MDKFSRLILAMVGPAVLGLGAVPAQAQQIAMQDVVSADRAYPNGYNDDVTYTDTRAAADSGNTRLVDVASSFAPSTVPRGIASYGPFRVIDSGHAALVDVTGAAAPAQFSAMLRDYPGIKTLELVECPGTEDDRANLKLGRMIHARGLATDVPNGGSVRSGAVELFLAGVQHTAAREAEFAVHSWADDQGHEPADFAANAPENRAYLDYYKDMGMTPDQASKFYAMTNSVHNGDAKWLSAADMGRWVTVN